MTLLRRILISLIFLVVVAYLAALGYFYFNQRALQYNPEGEITPLAETGLTGAEKIAVPVGDEVVNGWYHPPQSGKPVIVYYKGNSGSYTKEFERYRQFVANGYGFVAFDYRGFPASPGEITEENILADAIAVYDWVAEKGFPLVIWGRSLGSGPATYVASQREAKALLLETPLLSAANVAVQRYPFMPAFWLMHDQFRVDEWIVNVSEPVLVAHGTGDKTVDASNGEAVYALAPNKGELWIVPNADHDHFWNLGIWNRARPFFDHAVTQ
jgi:fermentation-respiration switch protein FrsA (DUF1100 family)